VTPWRPGADLTTLRARAEILTQIRTFFAQREVLEVQIPVLSSSTVTDPDVESIQVPGHGYLQTSPEYYMKRLLAAGAPSIYSLGQVFRQDEQGSRHNPEFTMLEWYRLGLDDGELIQEVAELVDVVLGEAAYASVTYAALVGGVAGERAELDLRFAQACDALGPGRFFVTDYPADRAALARLKDSDRAARFELIIDGIEIANGYWELTDADEHVRRFAEDATLRAKRGLVSHVPDEHFLQALRHGLPDCAGVALGLDRLLMLALGKTHIKQTQTF